MNSCVSAAREPVSQVTLMDTTQLLVLEVGAKCNLCNLHHECPTLSRPQTGKLLTDDKIITLATQAYQKHGFRGLVAWHYYNEPTLQINRILGLMERIRAVVPSSRFLLWSNGTVQCDDPRMAMFEQAFISNYFDNESLLRKRFGSIKNLNVWTPVFDARLMAPTGEPSNQRCLRPFVEIPVDAFGEVHLCCQDWKNEVKIGNVWSDSWEDILAKRLAILKKICGPIMADDAPDRCLRCAGRYSGLDSFDNPAREAAIKWCDALAPAAEGSHAEAGPAVLPRQPAAKTMQPDPPVTKTTSPRVQHPAVSWTRGEKSAPHEQPAFDDQSDDPCLAIHRALKSDPVYLDVLRDLANVAFQKGLYQEGAELFEWIHRRSPDDLDSLLGQAKCSLKRGHHVLAKILFDEALMLQPKNGGHKNGAGFRPPAPPNATATSAKPVLNQAKTPSPVIAQIQETARQLIQQKKFDKLVEHIESHQELLERMLRLSSKEWMFDDEHELRHVLVWAWQVIQKGTGETERCALIKSYVEKHPSSRLAYMLKAEHEIAGGQYAEAIATCDWLLSMHANDVFPQQRRAHAEQLASSRGGAESIEPPRLSEFFCSKPFEHFEAFHEGRVFVCCQPWLPRTIGNLKDEIEDVWNGPAAQELRRSILDGDFSHCSRMRCPAILSGSLPKRDSIKDPALRAIIDQHSVRVPFSPRFVNLSYDGTCNLSCPSCRKEVVVASREQQIQFANWGAKLKKILPGARELLCSGSGDPFASSSYRELLCSLEHADNPGLLIRLETNGILLTEANWQKLSKIHRNPINIQISIDSATEKTYEILRRGGKFQRLLANLEFVSRLRRENKIQRASLVFVVQALNYREMPGAVDITNRFGLDSIIFLPLTNWGTYSTQDYLDRNVCNPRHPLHNDFAALLARPEFKSKVAHLNALPVRIN
jgi:MoaA/NifB/PqqE/SkfB family radical SAM enzyme/tetratricopeptide (TPR) repeat protein